MMDKASHPRVQPIPDGPSAVSHSLTATTSIKSMSIMLNQVGDEVPYFGIAFCFGFKSARTADFGPDCRL